VNLVDRLLDDHFDDLGLDRLGLGRGLRSALVTPGFATSRHVVAMVFEPGAAAPCLVVKLPRRAGDNAGVETEGHMLRRLTGDARARVPGVPRFVGLLNHHGHSLLIEEAVRGAALDPAAVRRDPQGAVEAGVSFTASLPGTGVTAPGDRWYERSVEAPLRRLSAFRPFGDETSRLLARTHDVLAPLRESAVPTVVEHGDLSHPNILRSRDGVLQVIDWERSDPLGILGHDLVFYLQYVHESLRSAYTPAAQLEAFDHAFVGPHAPAGGLLRAHLAQRGVDPGLLPQVLVATWARAAATLPSRLVPDTTSSVAGAHDAPEAVRAAIAADRDVLLWRHALGRFDALC